jgi:single-strand DNA-binding protein
MNNLNSVLLEGNLVRDPELKKVGSIQRSVCRFSIGVNRYYRKAKDDEVVQETLFIEVETWGVLAENCAQYLKKGRGVRVVGYLKQENWEGKEDKKNHSRIILEAEHVEFRPDQGTKAESPAEMELEDDVEIAEEQ